MVKALDADLYRFLALDISMSLRIAKELDKSDSINHQKAQQLRLLSQAIRTEARRWWEVNKPEITDTTTLTPAQELALELFGP